MKFFKVNLKDEHDEIRHTKTEKLRDRVQENPTKNWMRINSQNFFHFSKNSVDAVLYSVAELYINHQFPKTSNPSHPPFFMKNWLFCRFFLKFPKIHNSLLYSNLEIFQKVNTRSFVNYDKKEKINPRKKPISNKLCTCKFIVNYMRIHSELFSAWDSAGMVFRVPCELFYSSLYVIDYLIIFILKKFKLYYFANKILPYRAMSPYTSKGFYISTIYRYIAIYNGGEEKNGKCC